MIHKKILIISVLSSFLFGDSLFSETELSDVRKSQIAQKRIHINLSTQTLSAYNKGGSLYLSTRISTGRYGHPTPVGFFTVLEKKRAHKSTSYPRRKNGINGGASMPYMLRITWDGIAIHEGVLPTVNGNPYPDSHGCIRVPNGTAKELFDWADRTTVVDISGKIDYKKDRVNRARLIMSKNKKTRHRKSKRKRGESYANASSQDIYIGGMDFPDDNTKGLSYSSRDLDYLENL